MPKAPVDGQEDDSYRRTPVCDSASSVSGSRFALLAWPPRRSLVCLVLCSLLLTHCVLYLDSVVDDAYVSYRYARSLVEGHGLTFNPGELVEGFSNPLWVFLSAGVLATGLEDPHDLHR